VEITEGASGESPLGALRRVEMQRIDEVVIVDEQII
jgi:hypothetical protein